MKMCCKIALLAVFLLLGITHFAQGQEPKMPTPEEMAEKEADRLATLLDLEVWQVFYVDSTLKHDLSHLQVEMNDMQKSKVSNSALYISVNDRWMDKIDASFRKIFTDSQWAAYLKSGAGKMQKARQKRQQKAAGGK